MTTLPQYLTCHPTLLAEAPGTVRVSFDFDSAGAYEPIEVTVTIQPGNTTSEFVIYPPPEGLGYHDFVVPAGSDGCQFNDKSGHSADAGVLVA